MPIRECDESRKNLLYGVWLKPKRFCNGRSATKPRIGERSTTIPYGSTNTSDWYLEMVNM